MFQTISWCRLLTFSIFFIVGVSAATLTQLDEQGLCAELTASGLGGGVCGPPPQKGKRSWWQQHPKQLKQSNGSDDGVATPRRDVCPILCKNGLGNPLCKCKQLRDNALPKTNFTEVCSFFCSSYALHVSGCPSCNSISSYIGYAPLNVKVDAEDEEEEIDWEAWCKEKCSFGDGGVACNCDILPLNLPFT